MIGCGVYQQNVLTLLLAVSNSWLLTTVGWQQQKMTQGHPQSLAFLTCIITFFVAQQMECDKSVLVKIRRL